MPLVYSGPPGCVVKPRSASAARLPPSTSDAPMSSSSSQSFPTPAAWELMRAIPTHACLRDLSVAARDAKVMDTDAFRKLVAFVLESADGRDRRESWTTRPGDAARQVPRLRLLMEACYGIYADVHWFALNKTCNRSGRPLQGLFPRMAAGLSRVAAEDFAAIVTALVSERPDAALTGILQARDGRISGLGVESFSRLTAAFRPDLYTPVPRAWGERSGALAWIDGDLRRVVVLGRNLRPVADELGLPAEIRGSVLGELLGREVPPPAVAAAVHRAIGPSIRRFAGLPPREGWTPTDAADVRDLLPGDFAAEAIRARRGRTDLRQAMLTAYGERCAATGPCVADVLEVAFIAPFPDGGVHDPANAILLRADVHTLWDLDLIGIQPGTMRIAVAPALLKTPHGRLAGRELLGRVDGTRPSAEAIAERWANFIAAHPEHHLGESAPARNLPATATTTATATSSAAIRPRTGVTARA